MFEIGQRVWIRAEVVTRLEEYGESWELIHRPAMPQYPGYSPKAPKSLYRRRLTPEPLGIIAGQTVRATGIMDFSMNEDEQSFLDPDKWHRVWKVIVLPRVGSKDTRWREPILALEEDIEIEEEANDN